ncbi:MAG: hypothetical protein ACTS27_05905 [Phycisphaerales bacterium]
MRTTSRAVQLGVCAMTAAAYAGGPAAPDAIIGAVYQGNYFGQANGVAAYAFGYATCNVGDAPLVFEPNNNDHPVWTQNLYRLKDGVLLQLGMSHLVHGFFALEQSLCGSCSPVGLGDMGPGCSDVNSAGLAGQQPQLGPRWQVNASTGQFPFPFFSAPYEGTIGRRLQVPVADVDPALNDGATYWVEIQTVTPGDAAGGNGANNASSREVAFSPALAPVLQSDTDREVPVVEAWANLDPEVTLSVADLGDEGVFSVASRAYDNGDGTWLYVYAVHNLNSDRAANAFSVYVGSASPADANFHSPAYHSGDGVNGVAVPNTPWAFGVDDLNAGWATESFADDPNANALRWATTYTYWFTSDREPASVRANLSFFKPGDFDEFDLSVVGPNPCLGNVNGDPVVNFADLNGVLASYGDAGENIPADTNGDGVVNFTDLNNVLVEFGINCY